MIDDFTEGPFTDMLSSGANVAQQNGNMIGGQRDLGYSVVSNPLNANLDITIDQSYGLAYAAGPRLGGEVALDYDGDDVEPGTLPFNRGPGLGSLDWSDLAKISVDFLKIDLGITVEVLMQSFDDNGDLLGTAINQQVLDPSVVEISHDFLFGDFVTVDGAPSFADVDRLIVTFNVDNETNRDFVVRQITAMSPAPGAFALLMLAGFVGGRRRRA